MGTCQGLADCCIAVLTACFCRCSCGKSLAGTASIARQWHPGGGIGHVSSVPASIAQWFQWTSTVSLPVVDAYLQPSTTNFCTFDFVAAVFCNPLTVFQALRRQLLRGLLWPGSSTATLSTQQRATLADCARRAEACSLADLVLLVERTNMIAETRAQGKAVDSHEKVGDHLFLANLQLIAMCFWQLEALQHTLESFVPVALRGVDDKDCSVQGFQDVGGLSDAKSTLLRTILWPVKVCTFPDFCKGDSIFVSVTTVL